jgi:hypothetical protein
MPSLDFLHWLSIMVVVSSTAFINLDHTSWAWHAVTGLPALAINNSGGDAFWSWQSCRGQTSWTSRVVISLTQ